MSVTFDRKAEWDSRSGSYLMWAQSGSEPVLCLIPKATFEASFDRPQPTLADIKALFSQHRPDFEAAFRRMIEAHNTVLWPDPLAENSTCQTVLTAADFAGFVHDRKVFGSFTKRPKDAR